MTGERNTAELVRELLAQHRRVLLALADLDPEPAPGHPRFLMTGPVLAQILDLQATTIAVLSQLDERIGELQARADAQAGRGLPPDVRRGTPSRAP